MEESYCFWRKSDFQNGRRQPFWKTNLKKGKLCIDLKCWEMRSNVIFGHQKWPPVAILWTKFKKKVTHWSEMARNLLKSDFRSSKMAAGGNFAKQKQTKKSCVLIRNSEIVDQILSSEMATRLLVWWKPCIEMLRPPFFFSLVWFLRIHNRDWIGDWWQLFGELD